MGIKCLNCVFPGFQFFFCCYFSYFAISITVSIPVKPFLKRTTALKLVLFRLNLCSYDDEIYFSIIRVDFRSTFPISKRICVFWTHCFSLHCVSKIRYKPSFFALIIYGDLLHFNRILRFFSSRFSIMHDQLYHSRIMSFSITTDSFKDSFLYFAVLFFFLRWIFGQS